MKIVFLNCWQGHEEEALGAFLREQRESTDIFCFQEAHGEAYEKLVKEWLGDFTKTAGEKKILGASKQPKWNNETFLRKPLRILESQVLLPLDEHCGFGHFMEVAYPDGQLSLCNFYGYAQPGDKLDTEERLYQSKTLVDFFQKKKGLKILGGDFNLLPDTESIKLLEKAGYRNLITEYAIDTTRNNLSWSKYPSRPKQYYSDYVFVSPAVHVSNFTVPKNEISDHLPLILEVTL